MTESRECSECHGRAPADEFEWTYDQYGIVWRKVCPRCHGKVQAEISGWRFDPNDAGETLDPEDF